MAISEDRETLLRLIGSISRLLEWVVKESDVIQDAELLRHFSETLESVTGLLQRAQREIEDGLAEAQVAMPPLYHDLERAGLTGEQLNLKERVLDWILRVGKGRLKRVLEWTNSFLGSVATALPFLEFVSEYKEQLELVVAHQRGGGPSVPTSIFNLR